MQKPTEKKKKPQTQKKKKKNTTKKTPIAIRGKRLELGTLVQYACLRNPVEAAQGKSRRSKKEQVRGKMGRSKFRRCRKGPWKRMKFPAI